VLAVVRANHANFSLTQKDQARIPAELRTSLGINPGDRLSISSIDNKIIITIKKYIPEHSFGILKAEHAVSLEAMRDAI